MTPRAWDPAAAAFPMDGDPNPFVRFRELLQSYAAARASGESDEDFVADVRALDAAVAGVCGTGFRFTPFSGSPALGGELGLPSLWIKDETRNVAESHKARHLFGRALRPPRFPAGARLAIASCGNAARAAAVVAKAGGWQLDAYVPKDADHRVARELERLGAHLVVCERAAGDPPGDPCVHAMRAAVRAGALPFTCQGTEDFAVLEGASTLAWELVAQHASEGLPPIDAVAIQVGGGALGTAVTAGFLSALQLGVIESLPRFFPVQGSSVAPFARAWRLLARDVTAGMPGAPGPDARDSELAAWIADRAHEDFVIERLTRAGEQPSRYMWPWEDARPSIATGILDDETYDWLPLALGTIESGGWPIVVSEETLARANRLAREHTEIDVGPTGTAGFAGLLDLASEGSLDPDATTVALFTGEILMAILRAALVETCNAYADMPTDIADLGRLAGRLEAVREANVAHLIALAADAAAAGARIVCFGELCPAPYFALGEDALWFELAEDAFDGPTVRAMRTAARAHGLVLIVPIYERDAASGARFNTAVVIDEKGEVLGRFRKVHIPHGANERAGFHETFYYGPSDGRLENGPANISTNPFFPVFQTSVGRIGVAICYDRHFPGTVRSLAAGGAQVVFTPAVTFGEKSRRMWEIEFPVDAARGNVFIGGSNRRGSEAPWSVEYFGASYFCGPGGRIDPIASRPELIVADLDLGELDRGDPSGWNLERDARPDAYTP